MIGCEWLISSHLHECEYNRNIEISFKQYGILNQFLRHNTSVAMFYNTRAYLMGKKWNETPPVVYHQNKRIDVHFQIDLIQFI